MKNIIMCCDGTWQSTANEHPTNVVKLSRILSAQDQITNQQIVHYSPGLGVNSKLIHSALAGLFGAGIDEEIIKAYRFLCMNYEPGDKIYLFGFSRGAYTVRSLAGLIYSNSLLKPDSIQHTKLAYKRYRSAEFKTWRENEASFTDNHKRIEWETVIHHDVEIEFLGCWDTVGALGIPNLSELLPWDKYFNKRYQFHDHKLSRIIRHARHAIAIDEHRKTFNYTPMKLANSARNAGIDVQEKWFAGSHTSIGGSDNDNGLSDITLEWMIGSCEACGNSIYFERDSLSDVMTIAPNPLARITGSALNAILPFRREVPSLKSALHNSVLQRMKHLNNYRPKKLSIFHPEKRHSSVSHSITPHIN